jgi:hypothetical protein
MMKCMIYAPFRRSLPLAAVAALLLLSANAASASTLSTVVGNLATAPGSSWKSFNTLSTRFAQGFTTGASPQFADNDGNGFVSMQALWHLQPGNAMQFVDGDFQFAAAVTGFILELRADNGGVPGSVIGGPVHSSTDQEGELGFSLGSATSPLQPNSSYWLTLAFYAPDGSSVATPASILTTTDTTSTGSGTFGALLVSDDSGTTWGGASERAILELRTEAVPEPSTWALAALGIAAAALTRRSLRKTAA